jgi:predicted transposase YbfD/YdcC
MGPAGCGRKRGVSPATHEGELSVAPALLAALPLAGAMITGDALYCQRALCQQIIDRGGPSVVIVKGHQPQVQADIQRLFADPPRDEVTGQPVPFARAEQRDRQGDRHAVRRLAVSGALSGYLDWPGAPQVAQVERTSTRQGQTRTWTRSVLTSLPEPDPPRDPPGLRTASAADLLQLVRGHWSVENRLHYVRDGTFGEDASQVRQGAAPQVLAALRNGVIALLRDAGWDNIAAGLRYNAWRSGAALQLLSLTPPEN